MTRAKVRSVLTTLVALALAGCIASQGPATTLSASNGSGAFVIYLVMEEGELVRSDAWWSDEAPELDLHVSTGPGWEAIVLKNDVAVHRVPVLGSYARAFLLWNSATAQVAAGAGDDFEVIVVNGTTEATMATFGLEISP